VLRSVRLSVCLSRFLVLSSLPDGGMRASLFQTRYRLCVTPTAISGGEYLFAARYIFITTVKHV